jgi:hypothetical protein
MNAPLSKWVATLAVLAGTAACGPAPNTPTAPSVTTLTPLLQPRVGGLWAGTLTFTVVAGGTGIVRTAGSVECVGETFATVIGQSNDSTLQITQDGMKVTGRLTSSETGLACSYAGAIGSNGGMVLDATQCSELPLIVRCLPDEDGNTPVRQMVLVGSSLTTSLNAPVNVTAVSGTAAHTYNVLDASGEPVGGLVAKHIFTLTRR